MNKTISQALKTPGATADKSAHTPGPWEVTPDEFRVWSVSAERITAICAHNYTERSFPSSRANARLIAAAPELLQALKAALPILDDATQDARTKHGNGSRSDLAMTNQTKAVRAAVAKATGGNQ